MLRFPKSGSSSSSSWQRSDSVIDVLLPRYYEDELDTDHFQESPCRSKELEHDDGDTLYAEALLNSDFLAWLNSDDTNISTTSSSSSTTATPSSTSTALERLRMLVAHASPAPLPPPTFHHDSKGKGKGRQT